MDIVKFVKKWSDLLILLPVAASAFAFADTWIRKLDPTASVLDTGTLSILVFNLLLWVCVFGGSYFFYVLNFKDWFQENWERGMPRAFAATLHFFLWLSVTVGSFLILTRNL